MKIRLFGFFQTVKGLSGPKCGVHLTLSLRFSFRSPAMFGSGVRNRVGEAIETPNVGGVMRRRGLPIFVLPVRRDPPTAAAGGMRRQI